MWVYLSPPNLETGTAMKFSLPLFLLCCLSASAFAEPLEEAGPGSKRKILNGSVDQVVCVNAPNLKIRASDLFSVLFTVPNHSPVKVFQGWGTNKKTKLIEGKQISFVRVQLPAQGEKV